MNNPKTTLKNMDKAQRAADALQCKLVDSNHERDDADRRAGAAERELAKLSETLRNREIWMDNAKEEAGYSRNVSFDIVWADLMELKKKGRPKRSLESANQTISVLEHDLFIITNCRDHWKASFDHERANVIRLRELLFDAHKAAVGTCDCRDCGFVDEFSSPIFIIQ